MKYLLVTADDFGRSRAVNQAIEEYHRAGALTQASLMVNEPAAEEAMWIARRNPELCVGLHLTLCDGRAARISALTDRAGMLPASPARAGLSAAFSRSFANALEGEIERQFSAFLSLGFPPTYWDGHHHLHLHPNILAVTLPIAKRYGFRFTRLVREPRAWGPVPLIFQALSRRARSLLDSQGIRYADRVYGLCRTGRIDASYIDQVVSAVPAGLSELYLHPGAEHHLPSPALLGGTLRSSPATLCSCLTLRQEMHRSAPRGE